MGKDQKILVELIVVLVLVGFGFWSMKNNFVSNIDTNQPRSSAQDSNEGRINNVGAPPASISYADALVKYKDFRIQLDQSCQARPNNVTYKNNTFIMIDNRASVSRVVKVGSTFSLKGYGFKILKLSSAILPATWYVDCDKSQNVATILIQK